MRRLCSLLTFIGVLCLAGMAQAANCPSFTYTLTNGTTADANQVMANFNTLLNCSNINLAHNGANSDITSLLGLSTPLPISEGGTGNTSGTAAGLSNSSSGHFFAPTATVNRIWDRSLFAGAAVNDALFPNVTKDWLSTLQTAQGLGAGSIVGTQVAVLTDPSQANAGFAFLAGSQSLPFTSLSTSSIGVGAWAMNNNATLATNAWAFYGEAWKFNSTVSAVYGQELDPLTLVASNTPSPANQGNVVGQQIGCGAGYSSVGQFDCAAGLQFVANPMKWKVGINFTSGCCTVTAGLYYPMYMAKGGVLQWYSAGSQTSAIIGNVATAANAISLIFDDTGMRVDPVGGSPDYLLVAPGGAVSINQGLTIGNSLTVSTGAVTVPAGSIASAALANTTVTPNSYTNANITVNAKGQITAASNGTATPTSAEFNVSVGTVENISLTTWTKRLLNTTVLNNISGASLASNQITLPAGTYTFTANLEATNSTSTGIHVARLRNITDSTTTAVSVTGNVAINTANALSFSGTFTLASQKVVELDSWFSVGGNGNGGNASGENSPGADIVITKIG